MKLGAHGQQAALEDIRSQRRLLDEPDPIPPLRQDAAAELRTRLNALSTPMRPPPPRPRRCCTRTPTGKS